MTKQNLIVYLFVSQLRQNRYDVQISFVTRKKVFLLPLLNFKSFRISRSIFKNFIFSLFFLVCNQIWATSSIQSPIKAPVIVVTIKPIYGLVFALTNGITTPTLLCEGRGSTHTLNLVPSDYTLLKSADLVVWVGESYEKKMAKPLVKIIKPERILALDQIKDLTLYSQRTGGLFGSQGCQHCCEEEDDDDHEDAPKQAHEHQPIDGHFWLDIDNAKRCARAIADFIIQKYPEYKDDVSTNLTKLESDLDTLKKELKDELASIKGKSALIDHDSLQYMEKQFDFSIKGVLRDSESSESSANHLSDIKNELERTAKTGVSNVFFYESSSDAPLPAQLEKLANIYNVHFSLLDYVGDDLPKSIDVYQVCLRRIAVQIKAGFE